MFSIIYAAVLDQGICPDGSGRPASECATPLFAFNDVFGNILSVALPIGGLLLFVMLLVGGVYFILSGPDPKRVQAAKNTLTYAILGVIILALSFLVIMLISQFTGNTDILNFDIYL